MRFYVRMSEFTRYVLRPPGEPVYGTAFLPTNRDASTGVVVVGGSGGSEPSYVAELLAAEGFAALSLAYFGRPGLPAHLRNIRLDYFRDAVQLVSEYLPTRSSPIVIIGMSRGSEAALLCAVHFSQQVDGVVVSVPANLVFGSWPPGGPAWLLDGKPLPYATEFGPRGEDDDVVIPVERILGPVLLITAGADQVWPSAAMARAVSKRLTDHGHTHGHELLSYPNATHSLGYLVPGLPPGTLPPDLIDGPNDQAARANAWPKVLAFLRSCSSHGKRMASPGDVLA